MVIFANLSDKSRLRICCEANETVTLQLKVNKIQCNYTVREIQKRSWEFLGNQCAQILPVMFLEIISNLAVKVRNTTCKIQKLPSKKLETIQKK